MKYLLLLVAAATASAQASLCQADFYGSIPSVQGILCQLSLGDIPLCPASSCKEVADTRLGDSLDLASTGSLMETLYSRLTATMESHPASLQAGCRLQTLPLTVAVQQDWSN